jgi:hypothetical protein
VYTLDTTHPHFPFPSCVGRPTSIGASRCRLSTPPLLHLRPNNLGVTSWQSTWSCNREGTPKNGARWCRALELRVGYRGAGLGRQSLRFRVCLIDVGEDEDAEGLEGWLRVVEVDILRRVGRQGVTVAATTCGGGGESTVKGSYGWQIPASFSS